jgi:hypothetical protein
MDTITINFSLRNDAYRDPDGHLNPDAVAHQLRDIAHRISLGFSSGSVTDANGNTVGSWRIGGDE